MIGHLPEHAAAFMELFARLEHAMRRNGYARNDRHVAFVDWRRFANELGGEFFAYIVSSQKAETLVVEPPRVYYRGRGLQPNVQTPIINVVQLFERGVRQVRNNIVHGEKYVDLATERDDALVTQAHWVLQQAIARHPRAHAILARYEPMT